MLYTDFPENRRSSFCAPRYRGANQLLQRVFYRKDIISVKKCLTYPPFYEGFLESSAQLLGLGVYADCVAVLS